MYLCHKCSGLLANAVHEDVAGLLDCCCISGHVRGFEKNLTRTEAIQEQIKQQKSEMDAYVIDGVGPQRLGQQQAIVRRLEKLL
jgi:hypothetical protein